MRPALRAVGAAAFLGGNSVTNPATLTPALPTFVTDDLLLCFTSCKSSSATVATPAGWFSILNATGSNGRVALFGRRAVTGDTAPSVTWSGLTTGNAGSPPGAQCASFSGADVTGAVDVAGAVANDAVASSLTAVGGSAVTTTVPNALLLSLSLRNDNAGTWTAPTTFALVGAAGTTNGSDYAFAWAWKDKASPSPEADPLFSLSGATSQLSSGVMVAIKPAAVVTPGQAPFTVRRLYRAGSFLRAGDTLRSDSTIAGPATVTTVSTVPAVVAGSTSINATATPAAVATTSAIPAPLAQTGGGFVLRRSSVAGSRLRSNDTLRQGSTVTANDPVLVGTVATASSVPAPFIIAGGDITATTGTVATTSSVPTPAVRGGGIFVLRRVGGGSTVRGNWFVRGTPAAAAALAPAAVATTTAVGAPAIQTGLTVAPATVATATAVPVPSVAVVITAPATTVATIAGVPAPTVIAGGDTSASPATVATTTNIPRGQVRQVEPFVLRKATGGSYVRSGATIRRLAVFPAATPTTVVTTSAVGAATVAVTSNATVVPVAVATSSAVTAPGIEIDVFAPPATVATTSAVSGAPSTSSTLSPAVVATSSSVPVPSPSGGATAAVGAVATVSVVSLPSFATVAGPATVSTSSAVGAVAITGVGTVGVAIVATTSAVPAPRLSFTAGVTTVATTSSIPAVAVVLGFAAAPAAVATVVSVPSPALSTGAVSAPAAVATVTSVGVPSVFVSVYWHVFESDSSATGLLEAVGAATTRWEVSV